MHPSNIPASIDPVIGTISGGYLRLIATLVWTIGIPFLVLLVIKLAICTQHLRQQPTKEKKTYNNQCPAACMSKISNFPLWMSIHSFEVVSFYCICIPLLINQYWSIPFNTQNQGFTVNRDYHWWCFNFF